MQKYSEKKTIKNSFDFSVHDRTQKSRIEKEILKRLKFFHYFSYFPLEDELYRFLRVKVSRKEYKEVLKKVIKEERVKVLRVQGRRIFLPLFNSKTAKNRFLNRVGEYRKKISNWRFGFYIRLLKIFSQIKFIGLSGSLAWRTARSDDDIDLFIIAKKGRLWTGRFLAVVLAFLLGIKRKRGTKKAPGKVCLNLFFDEGNLKVPRIKQNEYVAFELLALKPILDREDTYKRLLEINSRLIKKFFPNVEIKKVRRKVKGKRKYEFKIFKLLEDLLEIVLSRLQLFLINRHKTRELITSTQLWFFPEDFEEKYKKLVNSSK